MSTAGPLLTRLLKDAAIFPPGNAPLREALVAHAAHRRAWYAGLVGPFVCPASRLDELAAAIGPRPKAEPEPEPEPEPATVAVVVDTGTGGVADAVVRADAAGLRLHGLELPLRGDDLPAAAQRAVLALADAGADPDAPHRHADAAAGATCTPPGGESFGGAVEIPQTYGWRDALAVVAGAGFAAKLRLGGPDPRDVPPADDVAAVLLACLDLDVPYTLTAGLHHAVADLTPAPGALAADAAPRHGFLNLLLATAAALDGADTADVAAVLARTDADALAAEAAALDDARAARVRRWCLDLGTCSIDEPVADLRALGLVAP